MGTIVRLNGGQGIVPSAEEVASAATADAARGARQAKVDAIIDNARTVIADVKAGPLAAARQDSALRQLARAVLFLAKGELNE